ncbi:MFS transporter [Bifidobacterium breve]|uniref:MFS transporter n=1 Tax=Bifidobacterium breve TaxID=1685 RepID=UPI00189C2836
MRGLSAFPYQLLAICGIFLTNVINYIIASYGSRSWDVNTGWRWMLELGAIPAAAFLLSMVRAPESPRSSFKPAEPKRDSRCSSTSSAPNRHAFALTTYASVKLETEMSHEFHDLFRPGLRKALVIGALIKA